MAWTQEKIHATLKSVVEKAQADPSFREKLKQNPREVLASEGGEAIPEFIRITIVDQNDADLVITLPKVQADELSDADLERVAGGKESLSINKDCMDMSGQYYEVYKNNNTAPNWEQIYAVMASNC